ncbi:MAG TPA: Eco57I restriction-modification methylase domain-containing protein [Candidatus Helicobacter avistercoris]|nr:Eco57I restriction-modification methylase domain-containing protein [Candidatus Helicobacter avistercoris]
MISFKHTSLKDFMKNQSPTNPTREVIERFSKEIELLLKKAFMQDDEEFQKNEINKFLGRVYGYDCNTKGRVDSAIYVDGEAQVLIEAKAFKNKSEFPKDTPLSKAFYESVLYYLREMGDFDNSSNSNNSIKHIILCNPYDFYVFDATNFRIFLKNKKIEKLYKNCDGKEGADKSNPKFYKDLEKYLKGEFEGELSYTYFSLKDKLSIQELTFIYQLLSPQVLLKVRKTLDANTLNKNFYEELLYILGLQEVSESGKSGGKILIKPSGTPNSLSDAIAKAYGNLDEETIFTLITTWNNRVLFLALLESMLLGFKHINKPFLDYSIIKDFGTLQSLFFDVLAQKIESRSPSLIPEFASIPYLNSSLFDRIALEREGKSIGGLYPSSLQLFSRSILRKDPRFKDRESLPLLEYLFEFLHAYDFTTTPKDISQGVKQNHDKLINSAVLGLVFEKLNGYKEGSFYTPSFITSYMCKESITQAVIEKFNSTFGWKCESLEELREEMGFKGFRENREEYFQTFLSLKICDPSVGSGHFLVSALNEMISIAYTLKLIPSLYESTLELENDEILIKTNNELHQYTKPSSPIQKSHQIQEELFNLKKSIIENCLFGVDINPNSCEITKLRLWIELLKYSYYIFDKNGKNTNALETLPNIDINIKCGNSLISNFPLDSNLTIGKTKSFSKNLKTQIQNYKDSVMLYKEGLGEKAKILQDIANVKATIISYLVEKNPAKLELENLLQDFVRTYGDQVFDINTDFGFEMIRITREKEGFKFNPTLTDPDPKPLDTTAYKLLEKMQKSYEALESLKSSDAFEWRFEFPEVLDEEGNFLGFDAVIGNPPYINTRDLSKNNPIAKEKYRQIYQEVSGLYDIFILFVLMGLRLQKTSNFAWIIPNKFTSTEYGNPIFEKLKSENKIKRIIDVSNIKTFDSASVYPILLIGQNNSIYSEYYIEDQEDLRNNNLRERTSSIAKSRFITMAQFGLKFQSGTTGFEAQKISSFIKNGYQPDSIPFAVSGSIDRYVCDTSQVPYMKKTFNYPHISIKAPVAKTKIDFWNNEKIVIAGMTKVIEAYYAKTPLALGVGIYAIYDFCGINPLLILGVLNSSFVSWYARENFKDKHMSGGYLGLNKGNLEKLPMFENVESNQSTADKIIVLVKKILEQKEQNPSSSTQELEKEIDSLVYTLYNLTDEEIKIIENKEVK